MLKMKVLPKQFALNGHTKGICPQPQKLEPLYELCTIIRLYSGGEMV